MVIQARGACNPLSYLQVRVKLPMAHGGCLGAGRRRRAWLAAKSLGEPLAGNDPGIPEWGNLSGVNL